MHKILKHHAQLAELRQSNLGRSVVPAKITVSVSDHCNHKCSWCFYRHPKSPMTEFEGLSHANAFIDRSLFVKLVNDYRSMLWEVGAGPGAVEFAGGGEPLEHPDFVSLVRAVVNRGLVFGIITNGSNYRPEWSNDLAKATWIRVSLDAPDAETHAKIHRAGLNQFDRSVSMVEDLSPRTKVGVSVVACGPNRGKIVETVRLAKSLGAAYARITSEVIGKTPEWLPDEAREALTLDDGDFRVLARIGNDFDSRPSQRECYIQTLAPWVDSVGNVYRCCNTSYTDHGRIGSIVGRGFDELWSSFVPSNFDGRTCRWCAFKESNLAAHEAVNVTDEDSFI